MAADAVPDPGEFVADEAAMLEWAGQFAGTLEGGELVFLIGDLGAGETTLVRGVLRAWGFEGAVKSPTYTLLEPYEIGGKHVYHFDFYRVEDSQELDFIGIDELLCAAAVKFVEWPDAFTNRLPVPDIEIRIAEERGGRRIVVARAT